MNMSKWFRLLCVLAFRQTLVIGVLLLIHHVFDRGRPFRWDIIIVISIVFAWAYPIALELKMARNVKQ